MRRPRGPRKRAAGGGDEAEGRAQAAPAGVGEREHGRAERRRLDRAGSHATGWRVAGVDRDHGDVEVGVGARPRGPCADLAVRERDRDLVAAQHVRGGEDAARRDHDARAAAPAAAEADHRRPDASAAPATAS